MNLTLCFKSLSLRTGDSSGGKLLAGCAKFSPRHPSIKLSVCPENPKPKKLSMGTMVVKPQDRRGLWGQGTGVGEEMTPKVSSGLQTHVHEGRYFLMGKIHTHAHAHSCTHNLRNISFKNNKDQAGFMFVLRILTSNDCPTLAFPLALLGASALASLTLNWAMYYNSFCFRGVC